MLWNNRQARWLHFWIFNRHIMYDLEQFSEIIHRSNFINVKNKTLKAFVSNVFKTCRSDGFIKSQYIKTVIRKLSVFFARRFARKSLSLITHSNSLRYIFLSDILRKYMVPGNHSRYYITNKFFSCIPRKEDYIFCPI